MNKSHWDCVEKYITYNAFLVNTAGGSATLSDLPRLCTFCPLKYNTITDRCTTGSDVLSPVPAGCAEVSWHFLWSPRLGHGRGTLLPAILRLSFPAVWIKVPAQTERENPSQA